MRFDGGAVSDRASLPPLGQVLEFMRLVWALDHALHQTSKRMQRTLGVTGPQRFVIRIVGRFPGIPAKDLARLLHIHPSTLTGILSRLERSGLLRRRRDSRDRRRSSLGLTEKGRKLDVAAEGTVEAAVARVIDEMSSVALEAASEALRSMAASLAATSSHGRSSPSAPGLRRHRALAAWRRGGSSELGARHAARLGDAREIASKRSRRE
jgi:DNA-binding MarR family transcriptional regulator